MNIKEFLEKYCRLNKFNKYHQIVWDLCSEIEETFDEYAESQFDMAIESAHYDITILLEVMRTDLPDYEFLTNMCKDLESVKNEDH